MYFKNVKFRQMYYFHRCIVVAKNFYEKNVRVIYVKPENQL